MADNNGMEDIHPYDWTWWTNCCSLVSWLQIPLMMGTALVAVGASRLFLKAHTFPQIIVGTILAIGLAYFELTYLFL